MVKKRKGSQIPQDESSPIKREKIESSSMVPSRARRSVNESSAQVDISKLETVSHGLKDTLHGNIYQLELLMRIFWLASEKKYSDFLLSTETEVAEKFDDIVFHYRNDKSAPWKLRLMQAKHKEPSEGKEITEIDGPNLLSTDDRKEFSIQKYFNSFLKIKQRCGDDEIFYNAEIEDLIIITNAGFKSEIEQYFAIDTSDGTETIRSDTLLKVGTDIKENSQIYKIKNETSNALVQQLIPIFEASSDFNTLVETLAYKINYKKNIDMDRIFKEYYIPLGCHVFERYEKPLDEKPSDEDDKKLLKVKFQSSFINGENLPNEVNQFREAVFKEILFHKTFVNSSKKLQEPLKAKEVSDLLIQRLCKYADQTLDILPTAEQVTIAALVVNPSTKKLRKSFIKIARYRESIKNGLAKKLNQSKITYKYLNDITFKMSPDFGKIEDLPKLRAFAKALAAIYRVPSKEKSEDLSRLMNVYKHSKFFEEVFKFSETGFTLHDLFWRGNLWGNQQANQTHLSTFATQFREYFISEFITDVGKDVKDSSVFSKNEFGVSPGFLQSKEKTLFIDFEKAKTFAQQIHKIVLQSDEPKIINNKSVLELEVFKTNLRRAFGHVFLRSYGKIKFNINFLNQDLTGCLKDFREELKNLSKGADFRKLEFKIDIDGFELQHGNLDNKNFYSKLPSLHDKTDVNEFFNKLKFVVNYPNRHEIEQILGTEIQQKLKLLDGSIQMSLIKSQMLEWFANRTSKFLSEEDAKLIWNAFNKKLSFWVFEGVTKMYFASASEELKFEKYDIDEFLKQDKQVKQDNQDNQDKQDKQDNKDKQEKQVLHLVFPSLGLGRAMIVQSFKKTQIEDHTDFSNYTRSPTGHIFFSLNSVKDPTFKSDISNLLKAPENWNLIVIECNSEPCFHPFFGLLLSEPEESKPKREVSRKVIFISDPKNCLNTEFKNQYKEKICSKEITIDLENLIEESKTEALRKIVSLQGNDLALGCVVDEVSKSLIDSSLISAILSKNQISIGRKLLLSQGYEEQFYIPRKFKHQVVMNKNIKKLVENNSSVMLVINETVEMFSELCKKNPDKNIHWLKEVEDKNSVNKLKTKLVWQESQGSISELIPFRMKNQDIQKVNEEDLSCFKDEFSIIIISDKAGMGKSTVASSLSLGIKRQCPSAWVLRIELNDFTSILSEETKTKSLEHSLESGLNFLKKMLDSSEASKLDSDFDFKWLSFRFNMVKNIKLKLAIIFDGFDEIAPNYEPIVIKLIKCIRINKFIKVIITTRSHCQLDLEKEFDIFAFKLENFSEEEQFLFLTKFWTTKLGEENENSKSFNVYARALVAKTLSSISDKEKSFFGIPLQLRMLAESFQENDDENKTWESCKQFLVSQNAEPLLPEKLDLIDLYYTFFKKKYFIYREEKKKEVMTNLAANEDSETLYNLFLEEHEKLAMFSLFGENDLKTLNPRYKDDLKKVESLVKAQQAGKERRGLIEKVTDGIKSQFIHRTMAEFFVAKFFINMILNEFEDMKAIDFLLKEVLLKHKYETVRAFFNSFILKNPEIILKAESYRLRIKSVENFKEFCDDEEQFFLHVSARENNEVIVSFLPDCEENESFNSFGDKKNIHGDTALVIASQYDSANTVEKLIEKKCNVDLPNTSGSVALHWAARTGNVRITKMLISGGCNVHAVKPSGADAIYIAAETGETEVMKELLLGGAKHDSKVGGVPMIHHVIHSAISDSQTCSILELLKVDRNATDDEGNNTLFYCAYHGKFESLKLLIKEGGNVYSKSDDGSIILHEAAISGKLEMFQWLVESFEELNLNSKDNTERTPFIEAVKHDRCELVKYLVERIDLELSTENILFEASMYGSVELVEFLIRKFDLDLDTANENGDSVLHIASRYGNLKLVEWFLKKSLSVQKPDQRNKKQSTALIEVMNYPLNIGDVSFEEGFWKKDHLEDNCRLKEGVNIHAETDLEIIKCLIENGADVKVKDSSNHNVLYYANERKEERSNVVDWLLENHFKNN